MAKKPYRKSFSNVKIFGTLSVRANTNHKWVKQLFSNVSDEIKANILMVSFDQAFINLVVNVICGNGARCRAEIRINPDKSLNRESVKLFQVNLENVAGKVFTGLMNPLNWVRDEIPKHNGQYLNFPLEWTELLNFVRNNDQTACLPLATWQKSFQAIEGGMYEYGIDNIGIRLRDKYIQRFAYPIITAELVGELAKQCEGKRVIDIGAGSGYLAYQLHMRGVNIKPIDDRSFLRDFESFCPLEIEHANFLDVDYDNYDVVIVSWPDYNSNHAAQLLAKLSDKHTVIYCGEWMGGCTADMDFFNTLNVQFEEDKAVGKVLNQSTLSFKRIHDGWGVYRRVRGSDIVCRKGKNYAIIADEGEQLKVQRLGDDFQPLNETIDTVDKAEFNKVVDFWEF